MFGRLVLLIAGLIGVWAGLKLLSSNNKSSKTDEDGAIEDMIQCPKCGRYVAKQDEHRCRGDDDHGYEDR